MTPDERAAELERLDMTVTAATSALTLAGDMMAAAFNDVGASLVAARDRPTSVVEAAHLRALIECGKRLQSSHAGMVRAVLRGLPEAQQGR